jgi:FtsP/CotA-like multicopper oxidase with cupredoxin domain
MLTQFLKRTWWGLALALIAVLTVVVSFTSFGRAAAQSGAPSNGIVCTTSPSATFTLTTRTGYVGTPDDNVIFMWGFSEGSSPFQHPGPVLCVNQGDTVTVILHNTLAEDVSIIFPGQQGVTADGAPVQPQFGGSGALTSLAQVAPANGGSVTYSFVAGEPGTYLYESGTDPARQVRMGLFGALIVRPSMGAGYAYNRADSQFNPDDEVLVLLSEIDPYLNQAVELGQPFDMRNYHPRYWMINGRGFPDSIAPNFASWLPSQPYGALAHITAVDPSLNPLPGLARYISVGTEEYPFHPHGYNARIIGRDGRALENGAGQDLSYEKYVINIGPGQTWDALYWWYDAEGYNADTNPVDVTVPNLQNMAYGELFSGSPYLGIQDTIPVGTPNINQCGEYYIIAHNHALYQITSWGVPMTGPITILRIDPPQPNACP